MEASQHDVLLYESARFSGSLPDSPVFTEQCIPKAAPEPNAIVIVDARALARECLSRSLQEYDPALAIAAVGSIGELHAIAGQLAPAAVLLMLRSRAASDPAVQTELQKLVSHFDDVPVLVVADSDEAAEVIAALDAGANGYVSTSESVKVLAHAIALARSGGSFVPASCILSLKAAVHANQGGAQPLSAMFTGRQTAVANALREGKPNKIIAYDLNMCESTVKVHVRHIMKKLKATNRTEVAYKLSEMVG